MPDLDGGPPGGARPAGQEDGADDARGAEMAAQALARARSDARARGAHRAAAGRETDSERASRGSSLRKARSPVRARRDDPEPLAEAIDDLVAQTGWTLAVAVGSVLGRWAEIVGPELAAHTVPGGLADGELEVTADSTAWATQLRLLAADLVRRLNAELGPGTVRHVTVRGPGGPPRPPGQWRVRGGRGPRDTYG